MDEPERAGRLSLARKLMHLTMAAVPAVGWHLSYPLALVLAGIFLLASLGIEAVRRWWPQANRLLWRLLPTTFREREDQSVLGSTWFAVGMFVALLVFGRDLGGTAILFLAWGDAVAEIVGRKWGHSGLLPLILKGAGKGSGQGKTLVGSLGCLVACLVAGLVGVGLGGLSPWSVLAGAVVATLVERRSLPPDDNLWIPILSGLTMLVLQYAELGGNFVLL